MFRAMSMAEGQGGRRPLQKGRGFAELEEGKVQSPFEYDVFISHASEDKESFVRLTCPR